MTRFVSLVAALLLVSSQALSQSVEQYKESVERRDRLTTISYFTLHTFPDPPTRTGWGMITSIHIQFWWDSKGSLPSWFSPYQRTFNRTGVDPIKHLWNDDVYRRAASVSTPPRGTKGVFFKVHITSTVYDPRGRQIDARTWNSYKLYQKKE
jgi:hypothetical protein